MGRAFEYRKARKLKRWGNMARTFTRIGKEIDIAVKAGGPDPANNTRLRILIQNAKAENMPKENVERAIKRAISKDTSDYKEVVYEGYAPHGVAIVVEAATDNNTRTVANVRHAFTKFGGSLGTTGSLDFMFDRKCVFKINKPENFDPEEFELEMIDYGVDEIFEDEDGVINLYGPFDAYGNIQKFLEENKYDIVSGEFTRIPTDTKELTPEERADVDKILDKLDEDEDVTNVYHNIKEDEHKYSCKIENIIASLHPQTTMRGIITKDDFVAQLVEQLTLNQWVEGSSPSEVTESKPLTESRWLSFYRQNKTCRQAV